MTPANQSLPAHFDAGQDAWIFSTFDDVLAALRTPELIQTDAHFRPQHDRVSADQAVRVSQLAVESIVAHRAEMEAITSRAFAGLPDRGSCDLVADFLQPWAIAIFLHAGGISGLHAGFYGFLGRCAPGNICGSTNLAGRVQAKIAGRLLERAFAEKAAQKSLFMGITQTLPSFLANGWLWLIQHPEDAARFRTEAGKTGLAFEDLLRRAGHVHTLYRRASASCVVGEIKLAEGDHVVLRIDAANYDPGYFADLDGRAEPHVSFGAGPHACPGSSAVRLLGAMATASLLRRWSSIRLSGDVRWNRGTILSAPICLPVTVE